LSSRRLRPLRGRQTGGSGSTGLVEDEEEPLELALEAPPHPPIRPIKVAIIKAGAKSLHGLNKAIV
jgi:hypothetical protein